MSKKINYHELIRRARSLRNNTTDAEALLWQCIRCRQLNGYKFKRQVVIGKYIIDFACFEKCLLIEVDGGQHSEQLHYDNQRTEWLNQQGFSLLRYWNDEVIKYCYEVLEEIYRELEGK